MLVEKLLSEEPGLPQDFSFFLLWAGLEETTQNLWRASEHLSPVHAP